MLRKWASALKRRKQKKLAEASPQKLRKMSPQLFEEEPTEEANSATSGDSVGDTAQQDNKQPVVTQSCPAYAAKSLRGMRFTNEDSWAAVANLTSVPRSLINDFFKDCLPTSSTAEKDAAPATCQESTPEIAGDPSEAVSKEQFNVHFFAVFDGHGGAEVAKHCADNLHEELRSVLTNQNARPTPEEGVASEPAPSSPPPVVAIDPPGIEAALTSAFIHVDEQLAKDKTAHEVGTTAVVALLTSSHLWVANCGDSRAVLCRNGTAVPLSSDHKASRTDEVSRVQAAGGYVWWDRVMGELAVSRAIGDHCLRPYVIAHPEVTRVLRRPEDQLLILASDGLWDVFSNQDACTVAWEAFQKSMSSAGGASKTAVKQAARALAKAAMDKGSRDNITVVIVDVGLYSITTEG